MDWLWIIPVVLLLPYVAGPILVLFTVKQAENPEYIEVHPESDQIPQEVVAHLVKAIAALKEDGLVLVNYYEPLGLATNVKAYLALLENRTQHDLAIVVGMFSLVESQWKVQSLHIEFANRMADDSSVGTNNSPQLVVTAPLPRRTSGLFPFVSDSRRLYQIHCALVKRHGGQKAPIPPREGLIDYLVEGTRREHKAQEAAGYFRLSDGHYVCTLKGALIMTYKLLPPLSWHLKSKRDRKAQELLKELGV